MPKDGYSLLISVMLGMLALLVVIAASIASRQNEAYPLPEAVYKSLSTLLGEEETEATPMVSPMTGKPTEVGRGQLSRGSPLD